MSFQKVDFVAFDIPQVTGFDVVLGRSLLQFMKLEFDYSVGRLRMEEKEECERMRFALKEPMLVSARVEGRYGIVRELSAVMDFNSPYCVILDQDAFDLGYPDAVNRHIDIERLHPDLVSKFACLESIQRGIVVKLPKVSVGRLSASNVDAVYLGSNTLDSSLLISCWAARF